MKTYSIHRVSVLLILILFVFSNESFSQKIKTIGEKEFVKYDNRLIHPSLKLIDQINLTILFSVDDEPVFRDMAPGNIIDSGYNYGLGVEYLKFFTPDGDMGIYAGLGYEFFPSKYQKVTFSVGYQPEGFFAFFPRLETVYGWDLNSSAFESQWRLYFALLRYNQTSFMFGLQMYDESFDDGFYVFKLNYAIQPRKW